MILPDIKWYKIFFLLFFFINCSNIQDRFVFSPKEKNFENQKKIKSLAIEIMQDLRPLDEKDRFGFILIPLIFWETNESYKRDFDPYLFFRAHTVLSHAIKKIFFSYGKFEEVYVAKESEGKDADYLIRGKILKTKISKTSTFYGLSIFGALFYSLGLPTSYDSIETEFEFELIEAKTNKTLLSKKYYSEYTYLHNIYMDSFQIKANEFLEKQLESIAKDCIDVLNK